MVKFVIRFIGLLFLIALFLLFFNVSRERGGIKISVRKWALEAFGGKVKEIKEEAEKKVKKEIKEKAGEKVNELRKRVKEEGEKTKEGFEEFTEEEKKKLERILEQK